ncbi:MAG: cytochrome P450 [Clostridiales bacterium]|nr:cytochrome P450 [Clostridiales bacterium]
MLTNKIIPQEKGIDHTLKLLKEGYLFIPNRVKAYQSSIFETRLLGKKVICISGKHAAKLFYNEELFQRKGALPKRIQKTLFGVNAIQTMDDERHRHRRLFFLDLLNEAGQKRLVSITKIKWQMALRRWQATDEIVLLDEVKYILCEAVCEWAGVPLGQSEVKRRADDFYAMVNAIGAVGPKYWQEKRARTRTEACIKGLIEEVRTGKRHIVPHLALYQAATYKDLEGNVLDVQMAAIELINLLRPIIAISIFITFTALALYEHEDSKEKLGQGDERDLEMFVQEVRRYYPFAPFLGAIVRKNFIWRGCKFKKGTLVLIDIYGTNHNEDIWNAPYVFRPERFKDQGAHVFDFIPQGGGNLVTGHRCPGEGITIELMKVSLDFLIHKMKFDIPKQDLSYSLTNIPSSPRSGLIIRNIQPKY